MDADDLRVFVFYMNYLKSPTGNRIKDYTGFKRNSLIAISYSHIYKNQTFWIFKCDCGIMKAIRPNKVFKKTNPTKTCGCWRTGNNALKKLIRSYKKGARIRGLEWNLSEDDFLKITSEICFYCKSIPEKKIKSTYDEFTYNGIDRKNNKIGYILENCLPCCTLCNKAKRDLDYDLFISWINKFKKI